MRVLSLFSGIGAHDLGLEWAGMQIVGQVEIDEYCQTILKKHWPKVPKWRDVTTVPINHLRRLKPDLITGGFPCQDISTAGKTAGLVEGVKSSLWREMWRIIRDLRPNWLLIENVPALRTNGADTVLGALEALGYTCYPLVVGAIHVGAPHQRQRVWIVCKLDEPKRSGCNRSPMAAKGQENILVSSRSGETLDDTESKPRQQASVSIRDDEKYAFPRGPGATQHDWECSRTLEPQMGRSVDGTARRLALKALGNCNPPQVVAAIGRSILKAQEELLKHA